MASFLARRFGVMALTMLCLTLIVFYLVNLEPNLKKLAISQTEMHATSEELESWLVKNGYRRPFLERYAAWLGLWPKSPNIDPKTGAASPRFQYCDEASTPVFPACSKAILVARRNSRSRSPPSWGRRCARRAS